MQGHIRKRTHKTKDGRVTVNWYVVIELARDSSGRRRQKWYGSYRTRKEAEAARIEILHQINTGTWVEPTSVTFEEWVRETWLPLVAQRLKPSAEAHYRNYLRLHILPTLGPLQFRQITAVQPAVHAPPHRWEPQDRRTAQCQDRDQRPCHHPQGP